MSLYRRHGGTKPSRLTYLERENERLGSLITAEIAWLERSADNYGGHPGETLHERAKELRHAVSSQDGSGK